MATSALDVIRKGDFELPTSDKTPKTVGAVILFITFGLFGTWSYIAPLDSAALAPGQVTVKSYRKTVKHLEGGIVDELLIRDGERVAKDQPLIRLDDTQVNAELAIVRGQLISLLASKARLQAERDLKDSVDFGTTFAPRFENDPRMSEASQNEESVFDARKNSREGEIAVYQQRLAQINEQISGTNTRIESRRQLLTSYRNEVEDLRALLGDGYVDIQRIRELDRQISQIESEIEELKFNIAQAKVGYSETELQKLQLAKNFQTEVVEQLREIEAKVFDLVERERALTSRLERSVIRAPESGMVLGLTAHTIGGVIRSGEPILDIVPESSELIVEAQVSPIDIDRVNVGLEADIRFSAFKSATTPVIVGTVTQLSPDRLVNQDTGMPYYLARVEIPDTELAKLGKLELIPGMPAEVLIKTGERTLFEYIAQPATNAFARSLIED